MLCGAVVTLATAGCGQKGIDRVKVHPTEGQVLWEGKPLTGALVAFHPKAAAGSMGVSARAQSDQEGRFRVSTYDTADGAAAGEYAVTVLYYPLERHGDSYSPGKNSLPQKYASPNTTDLFVRVVEGTNTLPPLRLGQ